MKLGLFIRSSRGLAVLKSILSIDTKCVDYVVLEPDPSVHEDADDEIKDLCAQYQVPCFARRDPEYRQRDVTAILLVAWRYIESLENKIVVVMHDSDLPRYRGFAPVVNMLINGERHLAVTAFHLSGKYDRGSIVFQEKIQISYPMKLQRAFELLSSVYASIAQNIVRCLQEGKALPATPQDETRATYSLWRDQEDFFLDWNWPAEKLKRAVDALGYPYAGARTILNAHRMVVEDVTIMDDLVVENRTNGKVFELDEGRPLVLCGSGILRIDKMRLEDTSETALPLKKLRSRFRNVD